MQARKKRFSFFSHPGARLFLRTIAPRGGRAPASPPPRQVGASLAGQSGFSLIEVVAALIIVGVLAAIASMGIVTGTRGYLQTKENTHLTQKAQLAMARIQRELTELMDVVAVDNTQPSLIFDNPAGRQGLEFNNGRVLLHKLNPGDTAFGADTGHTLADQTAGLNLTYYDGDTPGWQPADGIRQLSAVDVELTLQREESPGDVLRFSTLIHPRNNDNYGGAPTGSAAYTAPRYECFVAGAAATVPQPCRGLGIALAAALTAAAAVRIRRRRKPSGGKQQCGNVLVGLVVVMLIFSALGAGMVSMTSTTGTEQLTANSATRAYYLAESGFRYAASEYLNTNDANSRYGPWDERNATLTALHDKTYRLRNNAGEFALKVYPSFLEVTMDTPAGIDSLPFRVPGAMPPDGVVPVGTDARLLIDDIVYPYNTYVSDTFQQVGWGGGLVEPVYAGSAIMLVGLTGSNPDPITQGGSVVLKDGRFFPEYNGRIRINGDTYRYQMRSDGYTLTGLTRADDPGLAFSLSLATGTEVVLEPSVTLQSVGTFGSGDLQASRTIHYDVGLPVNLWDSNPLPGHQIAVKIPMNMEHFTADRATFVDAQRDGRPAVAVDSYDSSGPLGPKSAELGFDWTTTQVNFASAHRSAGRYLSYDAQFKMGFDSEPFPDTGWGPEGSPVPLHYMAGMSFRMTGGGSMLGLSFQRGSNGASGPDNIDSELVPVDDVNAVVLWREKAGDGVNPSWLAYAETGLLFADGAELATSVDQWTAVTPWTRGTNFQHRGVWSWTTSPSGDGSYTDPSSGNVWNDSLTSEAIDLTYATSAKLTFWTRYRLVSCQDYGYVDISGDGGATWTTLNNRISQHCSGTEPDDSPYAHYTSNSTDLSSNVFTKKELDITNWAGNSNVRIRFRFNRNPGGTRNGWWIDDVRVIQNFDVRNATLLLRLQEAKAVPFTGGSSEIAVGDVILQDTGAAGTVMVQPALDSGTWAGGDAAGVLWLNLTTDVDFTGGSALKKGATSVATAAASSAAGVAINIRYNLIRAYCGTVAGVDTPSGAPATTAVDLYDQERLQNLGGTANWPPDEGQALSGTTDYFTAVQWNDTFDNVYALRLKDENGRYTIIATDESLFYTPVSDLFPYTRPELGLHAAGHGTENVYYQDMAVQLSVAADEGIDVVQR